MKSVSSLKIENVKLETRLLEKLEWIEIRHQIEVLGSLLPDIVLNTPITNYDKHINLTGFVLHAKITGLATFSENYNKTRHGGVVHLTATLNAYFGALIEIIYFFKGDLLKLNMNEFVVIWRETEGESDFEKLTHDTFSCALAIQGILGNFKTENHTFLKLKMFIGYGSFKFIITGDYIKDYFIVGNVVTEAKSYLESMECNNIILSDTLLSHISKDQYEIKKECEGYKLIRILYNAEQTVLYGNRMNVLQNHCRDHFKKCEAIRNRVLDEHMPYIEKLTRNLSDKYATRHSPIKMYYINLRNYIFPRIYEKTDKNEAIEDISGFFNVVIMYIHLIPQSLDCNVFIQEIELIYKEISNMCGNYYGLIEKLQFIEDNVTLIVYFGFKKLKSCLVLQNIFKFAVLVKGKLKEIAPKFKFGISIMETEIYTGIIGHPMRREYLSIGHAFYNLMQITKKYKKMITCDYKSFKKSQLSSDHFVLLSSQELNAEYVFEFRENIMQDIDASSWKSELIGRNTELHLIKTIIVKPEKVGDYYGICFFSKNLMGKSTLLKCSFAQIKRLGFTVTSVILPMGPQRPYFCLSQIYKQLYNMKSHLHSEEFPIITQLSTDLWNILEIFQNATPNKQLVFNLKVRVLSIFRQIISLSIPPITVIYVDNIQYIDLQSLEMLQTLLNEGTLRLISAGNFTEEDTFDVRYKLGLCDKIKFLELQELVTEDTFLFLCDHLKIQALPNTFYTFIQDFCGGNPGLIEIALNYMQKKKIIEFENIGVTEMMDKYFTSTPHTQGTQLLAIKFNLNKLPDHELTFQSIYYDTLLSFSTNEQSVITMSVVLGAVFKRNILKNLLNNPPDAFLALGMIHLFEGGIFECASKYFLENTFNIKQLSCACCLNEKTVNELNFEMGYTLPKYAHCELIYFKDKYLKKVVYNVIEQSERDQLHLQLTTFLEEQDKRCISCESNNFTTTFAFQTFKELLVKFNESHIIYNLENESSDLMKQPDYIKNIIRKELRKSTDDEEESDEDTVKNRSLRMKKLKPFDPNICFCIDVLIRTYHYLIENSKNVGHQGKRIFFQLNYIGMLISMAEYNEALNLLKETEALCCAENLSRSRFVVSEQFLKLLSAKTKLFLGEIHYKLGNTKESKLVLSKSLNDLHISEQYSMPESHSFVDKIISKTILRKFSSIRNAKPALNIAFRTEMASCFNLASQIFLEEENPQLSLFACLQSYHILGKERTNIRLTCSVYGNALETCSYEGNAAISKRLINIALKVFSKLQMTWDTEDLYSIISLSIKVFEIKLLNGDLDNAVTYGYKVIEICKKVGAHLYLAYISTILASSLLMLQRVQDAVEVIKYIQNLGRSLYPSFLLQYYSFAAELMLDSGFTLEPLENIAKYADEYFFKQDKRISLNNLEIRLCIMLFSYYLRNNQYNEAMRWKNLVTEIVVENPSFIVASNLFRYTECLMIASARNLAESKAIINERKKFKNYMESCEIIAYRWNLFLPRFLHYKAYNCQLTGRKRQVKKFLKAALNFAQKQGNILEYCWLVCSENSWQNFQLSAEHKIIDWQQASTYNFTQWSHLLYPLPSYI